MCLEVAPILTERLLSKGEKTVTVYKHLVRRREQDGTLSKTNFFTPYRGMAVKADETIRADIELAYPSAVIRLWNCYMIERSGVHAYLTSPSQSGYAKSGIVLKIEVPIEHFIACGYMNDVALTELTIPEGEY